MKYVQLNSDIAASNVALGIMRMEPLTPQQAAYAIETAFEHGINFFDSADIYGQGKSEEIFREGLKLSSIQRENFFFQSKGGIVVDPKRSSGSFVFGQRYDLSAKHLLSAVDGILKRSGVDYLDTFLLHRPDALMEPSEIAEAFTQLKQSGKVRAFGVSNMNPGQIDLIQSALDEPLIINQLQFSMMHTGMIDQNLHANMAVDRAIDYDGEIMTYCQRHGITIQAWSPFQYGFFDGIFIDNLKFPDLNAKLEELGKKYHVSKNAIATAWLLRVPVKMQVIIGTMTPAHIIDSAKGAEVTLDKQEWYDLYLAAGNDLP